MRGRTRRLTSALFALCATLACTSWIVAQGGAQGGPLGRTQVAAASNSIPVYQVVLGVDPVQLDVAVSDRGKAVTTLSREDFVILEDGVPQQIRSFEPVGMPYSILVMVDRSGREQKSEWPKFIISSVDIFLKNLRGPDRLAVAAFDDRVAVLIDWRPTKNGTLQRVMLRQSPQPTKFFEALNWAAEEMEYVATAGTPSQPGRTHGRRGVIVFTDGRDEDMYPEYVRLPGQSVNVPDPQYIVPPSVEARFNKSRQILQQGKVPFYFVAVDTDRQLSEKSVLLKLDGWMKFLQAVRTRVEDLASVTGGRVLFPRQKEDLIPLYSQIHRDLGSGYHITYQPEPRADQRNDGKPRRIEVRLANSDLHVYQSRDSYYAR
jgi:VWFA-related protein